jgi:hypothetical protein
VEDSRDSLGEAVEFSRENSHGVLHDDEQEALKGYIEDNYSQEVVSDFYDEFNWMYEWKAHRGADESVKLAVAYSRALGLDETEVKNYAEIDASEVTDEHVSVAEELHNAGREWFRHRFGESVAVYRGFRNGGLRMLNKLYEDNSDTVRIDGQKLQNWSWNREAALEWGRKRTDRDRMGAVVRAERDIDDFVFTIDGIAGEYVNHHDSALTFKGFCEIPKEQVSVEVHSNSVRDYTNESDEPMDREWVFYEGSFFPFQPVEDQALEAVKSMAIEAGEESSIAILLDDTTVERFADKMQDVRNYLETELDGEDPKDNQVLEAARKAEERTRKHVKW